MTESIREVSQTASGESAMSTMGIDLEIDPSMARFPRCVVWTPLPVISWLAPFIGHMGICKEDGVILDFAGPYFINVDNFSFGATTRYVQLKEAKCSSSSQASDKTGVLIPDSTQLDVTLSWDNALRSTMQQYQHTSYNLFTCNCHSFVASCLNKLAYRGISNWNVVKLVMLILFEGRWVNRSSIVKSLAPFVIVMCIGIYMAGWPFLTFWAVFNLVLIGWFVGGTYVRLVRC